MTDSPTSLPDEATTIESSWIPSTPPTPRGSVLRRSPAATARARRAARSLLVAAAILWLANAFFWVLAQIPQLTRPQLFGNQFPDQVYTAVDIMAQQLSPLRSSLLVDAASNVSDYPEYSPSDRLIAVGALLAALSALWLLLRRRIPVIACAVLATTTGVLVGWSIILRVQTSQGELIDQAAGLLLAGMVIASAVVAASSARDGAVVNQSPIAWSTIWLRMAVFAVLWLPPIALGRVTAAWSDPFADVLTGSRVPLFLWLQGLAVGIAVGAIVQLVPPYRRHQAVWAGVLVAVALGPLLAGAKYLLTQELGLAG